MNVAYTGPWPKIAEYDALLMDVARRIQLTKTKHETATTNFRALCEYVDREGSPLEGLVTECYPSGSFATGTAIASRVAKDQHDVDVVMEIDVAADTAPSIMLEALFNAINGEPGSRYHGKVTQNSRCVTVEYGDGTTVDLMPIARIPGPDRAGHLFHYRRETSQSRHKPVNPWGFAEYFKERVVYDPAFHDLFEGRRLLAEGRILEKAEAQPMPDHVPLEEKSPRVVALQLIKRARDKTNGPRGTVQVLNPAYPADEFTDRWPENKAAQDLFDADLRRMIVALHKLRNDDLSLAEQQELLKTLFGETAATYAIESTLDVRRREMEANRLHVGSRGKVLGSVAASAVAGASTAVRAATRQGGGTLPE